MKYKSYAHTGSCTTHTYTLFVLRGKDATIEVIYTSLALEEQLCRSTHAGSLSVVLVT